MHAVLYRVGQKIVANIFFSFLSYRLEFQSEILPTYLGIPCAHTSGPKNRHTFFVRRNFIRLNFINY